MTHHVHSGILQTIGHTPLVQLHRVVMPGSAEVIIKLEYYNPTGSYKDRMALAMIEGAEARGTLRPGMRVIEYTGGSTGSSLALVCSVKGYPFIALSSDAWSEEKLRTMRARRRFSPPATAGHIASKGWASASGRRISRRTSTTKRARSMKVKRA